MAQQAKHIKSTSPHTTKWRWRWKTLSENSTGALTSSWQILAFPGGMSRLSTRTLRDTLKSWTSTPTDLSTAPMLLGVTSADRSKTELHCMGLSSKILKPAALLQQRACLATSSTFLDIKRRTMHLRPPSFICVSNLETLVSVPTESDYVNIVQANPSRSNG